MGVDFQLAESLIKVSCVNHFSCHTRKRTSLCCVVASARCELTSSQTFFSIARLPSMAPCLHFFLRFESQSSVCVFAFS